VTELGSGHVRRAIDVKLKTDLKQSRTKKKKKGLMDEMINEL